MTEEPAAEDEELPVLELPAVPEELAGEPVEQEKPVERKDAAGGEELTDAAGEEESAETEEDDKLEEALEEEEAGEPEPLPKVVIHSSAGGMAQIGDEITLSVMIPEGYAVQWQFTPDEGVTVADIEGAVQSSYTFVLTKENMGYCYRVWLHRMPAEEPPVSSYEDTDSDQPGAV